MSDLAVVRQAAEGWRTGGKVEINLYRNDRPVAMCQTAKDARTIVALARLALVMGIIPLTTAL